MANLYVWAEEQALDVIHRSVARLYGTGRYFADWLPETDATAYVIHKLFPDGGRVALHVANVGLAQREDGFLLLALRPVVDSPEGWPFPAGFSVGVRASWPRRAPQPVLMIQDVFEIADSPTRPFERLIDVFAYHADPMARGAWRQNNVLTSELAGQLPPISVITEEKLQDWRAFIAWKRKLVQAKTVGLRYVEPSWAGERSVSFRVVSESPESLAAVGRALAREDIRAYPLAASSEDRVFRPVEDTGRKRTVTYPLGRAASSPRILKGQRQSATQSEVWAEWTIDLSEEELNVLAAAEDPVPVRERILSDLPKEGFLSVSMAGDLSLLRRHDQAVKKLREQGGYSPYLSAFLFDVTQAREAAAIVPPEGWLNQRLNDPQKQAVAKILAAPDVCMLQGPPGTGKTTVIAEAILHLVRRGESVLLASQAHTAVDNALARIGKSPAVRAIRLGRADKVTDEGREFVGARSLARYYEALAHHAESTHVKRWSSDEERRQQLRAWSDRAAYLLTEAEAAQTSQLEHDARSASIQHERQLAWESLQKAAQAREDALAARRALHGFGEMLEGSASPGVLQTLPVPLLPQIEALVEAIFRLHDHDLVLGASESEWRRLQHDRPHLFEMLLSDTRRIGSGLPIISEGLVRLAAGGTAAVQDPASRLRMQQLEAEIQVLLERMEEGAGDDAVTQWRDKRGELKAMQTQASAGLDAPVCRALFRAPQEWISVTPRSVALEELGVRVSGIASCLENVDRLVDELRQSVAAVSAVLQIPEPPDESAWRQAEAAMTAQEVAGSRLIERKCDIQRRAGELLHALPHSIGPSSTEADLVLQLREATDMAATALESMKASEEREQAVRHAWKPILQEWINDLRSPSSVENDWQHLEAEWPSQCNVVAITCNEREDTLDKAGHAGFDVAIIDEVSKATPLELLLPLMRARKAVLVGDHRQLPPLFQEGLEATSYMDAAEEVEEGGADNSALTQENLKRFERMVTASLFKEHFEAAHPGIRERLSVQFRMHPQIMSLVNHFYEGGLTCGLEEPDVERAHGFTLVGVHDHPIVTPKDHVAWIDTSRNLEGEVHCEDRNPAGGFMRTNRLEAFVIAQLLKQLDVQAVSQGHSRHKPLSVGVVSFYAGQLRLIRDAVKYAAPNGWQALDVEINTVIRYQGKEKDVVLVSLVRNDGRDGKSASGRSSRANFARYEFINVAFSRARKLLLVLGARSMLQSYQVELPNMDRPGSTRRPVYQEMFRQLEADGRIVDARHVMAAPQASPRRPTQPRSPRQGWRQ